jgi:glycosyltransferase involved in cell wall biosynthesis
MLINLVSRDNGVGLATDLRLLDTLLTEQGHDVKRIPWRNPSMRYCDVVIFLELFNPIFLRRAAVSVGVFNLEWFPRRWIRHLPQLTQLWAKSGEAYDIYVGLGLLNATRTGFLARDLHDPAVPRELRVLHLQGHSKLKNTDAVIDAWRRYPDLPPLTIITMQNLPDLPAGVTVLSHVNHDRLVAELNRHQIHLCPSRAEGWGHYIVEGMACEAAVITTDASPMSEHVQPGRGFLIPSTITESGYLAPFHAVDPGDVEDGVWRAASLTDRQRAEVGKLAREHVLTRNEQFAAAVRANLRSL